MDSCILKLSENNIKVACNSADTAFHNLFEMTKDGEPNNVVNLKYQVRKKCRGNFTNCLKELLDSISKTEQEIHDANFPFTWTREQKSEFNFENVDDIRFPELGDFEDYQCLEILKASEEDMSIHQDVLDDLFQDVLSNEEVMNSLKMIIIYYVLKIIFVFFMFFSQNLEEKNNGFLKENK